MLLRDYLLRLHLCKGIGIVGKAKVYEWLSQEIWDDQHLPVVDHLLAIAGIQDRNIAAFCASYQQMMTDDQLVDQLVDGENWLAICDPSYPEILREAYSAPIVLFYRGHLELINGELLGIVGAREATHYSTEVLKQLIPGKISNKMTIVSGSPRVLINLLTNVQLQTKAARLRLLELDWTLLIQVQTNIYKSKLPGTIYC